MDYDSGRLTNESVSLDDYGEFEVEEGDGSGVHSRATTTVETGTDPDCILRNDALSSDIRPYED
jgi:hypothetical protein